VPSSIVRILPSVSDDAYIQVQVPWDVTLCSVAVGY
jgi:hypothetical protein